MSFVWGEKTEFFYNLTPDIIDRAVDELSLRSNGQNLALNSLENRVYQVGLETPLDNLFAPFANDKLIIKFYRPGRWERKAILEEHSFLAELSSLEIPVIAPLSFSNQTLFHEPTTQLFYAVFPKAQGRLKDELDPAETQQIGRLIARIHNAARTTNFTKRPLFHPNNYLKAHFETLRESTVIPSGPKEHYLAMGQQLFDLISPYFDQLETQRIHGDFHRGNILWSPDKGPWVVDFDDCVTGPCQQDLWLLYPGRDSYSLEQREQFLESYNQMSSRPLHLSKFITEALRSIRMVHFNGWIAKRWEDPIFQNFYGDFNSEIYWEGQLLDIKEQLGILQDSLYEGQL